MLSYGNQGYLEGRILSMCPIQLNVRL